MHHGQCSMAGALWGTPVTITNHRTEHWTHWQTMIMKHHVKQTVLLLLPDRNVFGILSDTVLLQNLIYELGQVHLLNSVWRHLSLLQVNTLLCPCDL